VVDGRGEWIRTTGLLVPNQALYQAEPRPELYQCSARFRLAGRYRRVALAGPTQYDQNVALRNLRDLPAVNDVIDRLSPSARLLPHGLVVAEVRQAINAARDALKTGEPSLPTIESTVETALAQWTKPSLRHVVNATGVVLHTNLGRAPLPRFDAVSGYSNLEYDLEAGTRGKRDVHAAKLLEAILGRPAICTNNNAAALFLVLNELAMDGEAIVSRGELIEIGDGFRIPEIMQRSGSQLHEVGTTNRTHIDDYRAAINERTRVLLRVHPSNFRMTGFTARPTLSELVQLGRERGIPVYEDLGSGCIVDLRAYGVDEPLVQDSLAAGANLVSFSGDKLLGGPQAGIVAGDADLVARVRRNPLFRALRQDKLFYQAMETTLRHILLEEYDCIPALGMIRMTASEIGERADRLARRIQTKVRVREGESMIGGGATPQQTLPTCLIVIETEDAVAEERRLRLNDPPIIARIEHDRVVLDLRTVFPEEEEILIQALS
jgi:L-seryl-tRNA(Ser) seleniumtransferase